MTTILTPVDELKAGDRYVVGVTPCYFDIDGNTRRESDREWVLYFTALSLIFPDGVPVIQPDKPKEVRCVVTVDEDGTPRVDGEICVSVGDWLDILLENSKTYDLVLTEREGSK